MDYLEFRRFTIEQLLGRILNPIGQNAVIDGSQIQDFLEITRKSHQFIIPKRNLFRRNQRRRDLHDPMIIFRFNRARDLERNTRL